MVKKDSVGKSSQKILQNAHIPDYSPEEQMREQLEQYEKSILSTVQDGKKKYPKDFYIVVETKKEPIMKNVLRNFFFHRFTCPTPQYDEAVYKYHRNDEHLEFLWVLPDRKTYKMMLDHALEIEDSQKELLHFVLDDSSGKLLQRCKFLNGEIDIKAKS